MKQKLMTDYYKSTKKTKITKITKIDIYDFDLSNNLNDETNYNNKNENKIYGYNSKTDSFHCLNCGIDMGSHNPRQLCGKYKCNFDHVNY